MSTTPFPNRIAAATTLAIEHPDINRPSVTDRI